MRVRRLKEEEEKERRESEEERKEWGWRLLFEGQAMSISSPRVLTGMRASLGWMVPIETSRPSSARRVAQSIS